jgi:hypothetical protein
MKKDCNEKLDSSESEQAQQIASKKDYDKTD